MRRAAVKMKKRAERAIMTISWTSIDLGRLPGKKEEEAVERTVNASRVPKVYAVNMEVAKLKFTKN